MPTLAILLTLLMGMASGDPPRPSLRVFPRMTLQGAVRIETFVPRYPANRTLRVEVDGDAYFRAFEESVAGEDARVLFLITIDNPPEGYYTVTATVTRVDRTTTRVGEWFCRGPEGCAKNTESLYGVLQDVRH